MTTTYCPQGRGTFVAQTWACRLLWRSMGPRRAEWLKSRVECPEADAEKSGDPRPIEADLARQRAQLTRLVTELYRRGHELTDVGLQIRRHALAVAATFLAVGAIAAGSIALGVRRARRRNTLTARSGRLREAVGRAIDRPDRVAAEPTRHAAHPRIGGLGRCHGPGQGHPGPYAPPPVRSGDGAARGSSRRGASSCSCSWPP